MAEPVIAPKRTDDSFKQWYGRQAEIWGLNPNPDDPSSHYDWRSAYKAGAFPDKEGNLPDKFKITIPTVDLPKTTAPMAESVSEKMYPKPKPIGMPVQPAIFKREVPFEFMEDKDSPEFDVLSYKESEREVDKIVTDFNRGVYDNMKTVEELEANDYLEANSFGYQALKNDPELYKAIEALGPIGPAESWAMLDKWGLIPYVSMPWVGDAKGIVDSIYIFNVLKKNAAGETLTPKETQDLQDFSKDMIELSIRKFTIGGNIVRGAVRLPAYALEFAAAGFVLHKIGAKGTGLAIKQGILENLKGGVAKGIGKTVVAGAARTVLSPLMIGRFYFDARLSDSISVTDKGQLFFKESQEAPATTLFKAIGNTWIELASESAGGYMFAPISNKVVSALPAGFRAKFLKYFETTMGRKITSGLRATGYDGIISEMGEERLGDFLRVTFNLDPEKGYSIDQFGRALFPKWEDLLVEAGVIAIPGTMSHSMGMLYNKVVNLAHKRGVIKNKEELAKILTEIATISENQRESLLEGVAGRETQEERAGFEKMLEGYKAAIVETGVPVEGAEKVTSLWGAFATVSVSKLKEKGVDMTRSQWMIENAPKITSAEKGEGLGQRGITISTPSIQDIDTGKTIETGKPLTVNYVRNPKKAEYRGERFGQVIEPAGRYVNITGSKIKPPKGWESGSISFDSPLIIEHKGYDKEGWKNRLSENYGGLKGVALSQAIIKDGYDAIITYDKTAKGIVSSEVVDLRGIQKPLLAQDKRGAYDPVKNLIALLPTADRSTLLHESAHAFFEYYLKNMPEDLKAVFDWVGIKQKPLNELTDNEYRKLQESFARGFEVYIMEGRAPSSKLADVFQTFKEWLVDIYNTVTGLDIKLSDEVRQVYQDMLNVEADIEIKIDETMTAEMKGKALTLYQEAKKQIEELKKKRESIMKRFGKQAKANLAEVDLAIKDLETMSLGVRRAAMVREAEAQYEELPVSDVIKGKIRISPAYAEMMKRYGVPDNVKTTNPEARTVDEWAADLEVSAEEVLEMVSDVRSKSKFVDDYIAKEITAMGEFAVPEAEIKEKMGKVIEKLKEDAKKGDITEIQKEVIQTIRDMNIDNADKVKFLGQIQKAKTPYSQRHVLQDMLTMEQRYWEKQQRNILDTKIQKMLKQTKPKTGKGVTKGRFNYEDNVYFIGLRDINKMSQKEALEKAEAFEEPTAEDPIDQKEILTRILTNYKAYGKSKGSFELFEAAYEKLKDAISYAKEAKDQKDFEDKLNMQNKKMDFYKGITDVKFKGKAKSISTRIINAYRTGSLLFGANQWSLLNSIAGEKIADEYNMEEVEQDRYVKVFLQNKEAIQNALDIFELKTPHQFLSVIVDKYAKETHKLTMRKPTSIGTYISTEFNRFGIIDIYNAIKNDKTKNDYYREYGQENVDALVGKLTSKEKEWADSLMAQVQANKGRVDAVHIKQTGLPLGETSNYWPGTSVIRQEMINDNLIGEVTMATFQRERVKGAVIPVPTDAWLKFNSHIAGVEHVANITEKYMTFRKMIDSRGIKQEIETRYGKDVYEKLVKQVKALSLEGLRNDMKNSTDIWKKMLNNWVMAKVGLNVSVFAKQFLSTTNYIEQMPLVKWLKYFGEAVLHPKRTIEYMFKSSPYLGVRFARGSTEAIERALRAGEQMSKKKAINDITSSLVRSGDIGAITFGGFPLVKYLVEEKGKSLEEAIKIFENATRRSQQSPFTSSLDLFQQDRGFAPGMLQAFMNTPKQYNRKIFDAMISYYNGDISFGQFSKKILLYMVVQGGGYGYISWLMGNMLYGGGDENPWDDIAISMVLGPFNGFPLLKGLFTYFGKYVAKQIADGKKPYKTFSFPLIDDIARLWESQIDTLFKGKYTARELFELLSMGAELKYGLPVHNIENYMSKVFPGIKAKKKHKKRNL